MNVHKDSRRGERGSAYIVTLLVLLVLTTVGLALTVVTQTEMIIGAQDREIQSALYAADSGLNLTISQLVGPEHNPNPVRVEIRDTLDIPGLSGGITTGQLIDTCTLVLDESDCDACQINQGEQAFKTYLFGITSVATRRGVDFGGDDDIPLSRKQVTTMMQAFPLLQSSYDDELNRDYDSTLIEESTPGGTSCGFKVAF